MQSTHLGVSSTQLMWKLLAGNRTAVLPRRAWGRRIRSYPDLCASKYKLKARGTHTPTHGLAKQLSMAATARGGMAVRMREVLARLCTCVRYWQGGLVVYLRPLLYICPHARTVRERSREWGGERKGELSFSSASPSSLRSPQIESLLAG